jgi:hypothetical protein
MTDAPIPTRTLDEKIALTEALLAKYLKQKATEAIVTDIQVGDDVTFSYGRKDGGRELIGTIAVGIATDTVGTYGKYVGIETGEGFDKRVLKVRIGDITENRTANERTPATESDPLNAE